MINFSNSLSNWNLYQLNDEEKDSCKLCPFVLLSITPYNCPSIHPSVCQSFYFVYFLLFFEHVVFHYVYYFYFFIVSFMCLLATFSIKNELFSYCVLLIKCLFRSSAKMDAKHEELFYNLSFYFNFCFFVFCILDKILLTKGNKSILCFNVKFSYVSVIKMIELFFKFAQTQLFFNILDYINNLRQSLISLFYLETSKKYCSR